MQPSSSPQLQAIAKSVQKMHCSPPPPTAPRPLASGRGQPKSYAVLPMKTSTPAESQKGNQGTSKQARGEKSVKQPWILQQVGGGTKHRASARKPIIDTDSGNKDTTLHISKAKAVKPTDVSNGAQKGDESLAEHESSTVSTKAYNALKKELETLKEASQKEIAMLKTELSCVIASVDSLMLKYDELQNEVRHKSTVISTSGYVTCTRETGAEATVQCMYSVEKNLQELRNLNTTEVSLLVTVFHRYRLFVRKHVLTNPVPDCKHVHIMVRIYFAIIVDCSFKMLY